LASLQRLRDFLRSGENISSVSLEKVAQGFTASLVHAVDNGAALNQFSNRVVRNNNGLAL
jgi:hypothetical protein